MIDAQTLMQWTGCTLGVAGSIALARNDRYSGWGFVAYLLSNAAWLAYGFASDIPALALQHSVFAAVSTFGVWRWLVRPWIETEADARLIATDLTPIMRPQADRSSSRGVVHAD